ncbi:ABC transporter substrate-binding protein [Acrocarpospora sp. B8E8]|uniref:ABC transporter substrate-binding protein n=1 Tax=Acrocarpospora sp. B8E8 TaxID=3153572 RepID=UPI00325ED4CF
MRKGPNSAAALLVGIWLLAACSAEQTTASTTADRQGVLSGVCPSTVVIQADWEPEAEHGGVYHLLGDKYEIDERTKSVTGPLLAAGQDTGVDAQIRIGGSAVGYQSAHSLLYQDPEILIGFGRVTEYMVALKDTPVVSIMALLEKSPYAIFWDPKTYPEVQAIADLKAKNVVIEMGSENAVWQEYLLGKGLVTESQADRSVPQPGAFVAAGGKEAQAGFITSEPYMYEHEMPQWGRPVKGQLLHDVGYPEYFQSLVVRKADVTEQAGCLSKLIPIIQRSLKDYVQNSEKTNALIVELVDTYDTGWIYTAGRAKASIDEQIKLGLVSNGDDKILGNFDMNRVQELIGIVGTYTKTDVSGVQPADLVTNEFIDESIGVD